MIGPPFARRAADVQRLQVRPVGHDDRLPVGIVARDDPARHQWKSATWVNPGAHSISSIRRFVLIPPGAENPCSAPLAASTRWQGTTIGYGFEPSADPTARAACGSPIA